MITGRTRIAGVIGAPISQSLSPLLMNSWIEAVGIDAAYLPFGAREDLTVESFRALSHSGLAGLNVTLPFKTLAADCADFQSAGVKLTGAANLLVFAEDGIQAHNTDIDGIMFAFSSTGQSFENKTVLILGAGGVARAVCAAARNGNVNSVVIANRTRQKSEQLSSAFNGQCIDWADRQLAARTADIIVNATSLGMDGQSSPGIDWKACHSNAVAFDTVYTPVKRAFTRDAHAAGLTVIDGISMLIGQARPSFETLFGLAVPESIDTEAFLRKALGP